MEYATKRGGILIEKKARGKSKWQCAEGHIFYQTFNRVKFRGKWCPECGTKGERAVRVFFRYNNIPFIPQATFPSLPKRRYDFYFQWHSKGYIVEYDGEQHFRYVRKYHKTKKGFLNAQLIDRVKTHLALMMGCSVIRIDFTQEEWIHHHLIRALHLQLPLYVSSPHLYQYLYTPLTVDQFHSYVVPL